jgi:uncharacterized protein
VNENVLFDENTINCLESYVYCLVHPKTNSPFYVGKGERNRIFDHEIEAQETNNQSDKLNIIREIKEQGLDIDYFILRHGLSSDEAYLIESVIIDFMEKFNGPLTNEVLGHHSDFQGLMTLDEIKRRYSAEPLTSINSDTVIININKKYKRGLGFDEIYNSTKEKWVISKKKIGDLKNPSLKLVLAEYKGFIAEVFEVDDWYEVLDNKGKRRFGFNGKKAEAETRNKYINRSVTKKPGTQNPISYVIHNLINK